MCAARSCWHTAPVLPVTALGGGSNVLVADEGVRGVVVRLHGGDVTSLSPQLIRADAGVTINGLVRWTISRGIAGLEAWAGTPGTRRRRGVRQRAFSRPPDQRTDRRVRLVARAVGPGSTFPRPTWSSATTSAACTARARSCCRRIFRVGAGEPGRSARRRP